MRYFVEVNGREREVVIEEAGGAILARIGGRSRRLELLDVDGLGEHSLLLEGRSFDVSIEGGREGAGALRVGLSGEDYAIRIEDERERAAHSADRREEASGPRVVRSVIPGIVVSLLAKEGEELKAGAPLLLLEAMKMQNEIRVPAAGRLERVHVRPGETVLAGQVLATLSAAGGGGAGASPSTSPAGTGGEPRSGKPDRRPRPTPRR